MDQHCLIPVMSLLICWSGVVSGSPPLSSLNSHATNAKGSSAVADSTCASESLRWSLLQTGMQSTILASSVEEQDPGATQNTIDSQEMWKPGDNFTDLGLGNCVARGHMHLGAYFKSMVERWCETRNAMDDETLYKKRWKRCFGYSITKRGTVMVWTAPLDGTVKSTSDPGVHCYAFKKYLQAPPKEIEYWHPKDVIDCVLRGDSRGATQIPVNCVASKFPVGSKFCLAAVTYTVTKSWDSGGGATVNHDPKPGRDKVPEGTRVSFGPCAGMWKLGKSDQSCDAVCSSKNLECRTADFAQRNGEIDTETKMTQVMAALGHRCTSFRSQTLDTKYEKSVPLFFYSNHSKCMVSQPERHADLFSCRARPPFLSQSSTKRARRLCWCAYKNSTEPSGPQSPGKVPRTDIWTKSPTGCKCYFDESRKDCACCSVGACQCSAGHRNKCVPCGSMWKCVVSDDHANMQDKMPRSLIAALNVALQAKTSESQQQGIRDYLREVYHLPQTTTKVQMVGLLSAKLSETMPDANVDAFEFPEGNEVEDWLSSMFLEEELLELSQNTTEGPPRPVLGLVSLGASVQEKFQACNWQVALTEFYKHGGGYGNWCGKQPKINGVAQSFGGCVKNRASKNEGIPLCKDNGLDAACFRHDSGGHGEDLWGIATKSLCKVDQDFHKALDSLSAKRGFAGFVDRFQRSEAKTLQAAKCLFNHMPCLRYETKAYWRWCPSRWGGSPCKETRTGYFTYFPIKDFPKGDYSQFKDDACGPTGCYQNFNSEAE